MGPRSRIYGLLWIVISAVFYVLALSTDLGRELSRGHFHQGRGDPLIVACAILGLVAVVPIVAVVETIVHLAMRKRKPEE